MSGVSAGWRGELKLHYRLATGPAAGPAARTVAHHSHSGPLRVLQPLHPEGPAICHHVVLHPPGGVVAGDQLHIDATLDAGTHALITTPGATRFYRSEGASALQRAALHLAGGARLEWLPLETIAYSGCLAHNQLRAELEPGAQMMGWDVLALGLAAAGKPFEAGCFQQTLELPGVWLESARIAAGDTLLLRSPLGWDGQPVLATMWFAAGQAWPALQRDALLEAARVCCAAHALAPSAGVSAVQPAVLVLRVLAPRVEPAMQLLQQVRAAWRQQAWGLAGDAVRIWRT